MVLHRVACFSTPAAIYLQTNQSAPALAMPLSLTAPHHLDAQAQMQFCCNKTASPLYLFIARRERKLTHAISHASSPIHSGLSRDRRDRPGRSVVVWWHLLKQSTVKIRETVAGGKQQNERKTLRRRRRVIRFLKRPLPAVALCLRGCIR